MFMMFHSGITLSQDSPSTYYVDKKGSNSNIGTYDLPFLTINHAAQIAEPGDTINVREGTYREWINPLRGGTSEENRIVYQAEPGADVRILGSEEIKGWEQVDQNVWKVELDDVFFGDFNPFKTLTKHPEFVSGSEGGWGWLEYGRWCHLGDVIINGTGLTEKQTLEEVDENSYTWYTNSIANITSIYANFENLNPNSEDVELTSRRFAFFPEKEGLSYITLKGFTIMNVACHWAPPTVFQPAAVGPNGGHNWVIENNIIIYSKSAAISIGIPDDNIDIDSSGNHTIRNNVILRCGQAGIMGQQWNSNSRIYGNHIEDINYRKEFGGWETAAIKFHNADNIVVKSNFIRGVYTISNTQGAAHGIWNDYENHNWQVRQNVIINTSLGILAEANWDGPNLYANNILVNSSLGTSSSRGDAWIQNLFINSRHQWENQGSGRPQIGNARWFNNIFIGGGLNKNIIEDNSIYYRNVSLDNAAVFPADSGQVISSEPSDLTMEETNERIFLKFNLDSIVVEETYPIITLENINLPFSFDSTFDTDFYGMKREADNMPGPFLNMQEGENEFEVYRFSPLYIKALHLIDYENIDTVSSIYTNETILTHYSLYQNYPNPFNPTTTIFYSIPQTQKVTLRIYNILGVEITTLVSEQQLVGDYEVEFDGTNLSSGVYFYRIQAGDFFDTKKLILLK
jgi:alpha-N-arabinofuranosidase